MKKIMMLVAAACLIAGVAFAGAGEVTVKVSAPGLTASAALPKAKVAARRAAVKKYLESLKLKDLPDKVVADAQASYAKFTPEDIEEIQDEREFDNADKELTTSFMVEVDMPAISKWLKLRDYHNGGAAGRRAATAWRGRVQLFLQPLRDVPEAYPWKVAQGRPGLQLRGHPS